MLGPAPWWGLIGALLFFWAIGAYNRLVRLRTAVSKSFAALDEQLVRQLVWVQGCLPESMRGGTSTAPAELQDPPTVAWARVQAAGDQFAAALAQARGQAIGVAGMAALVMAHEALRGAWSTALATAVPADAAPSAERLQARWMRLLYQSLPLRAAFNDAAQTYNDAIAQFPALLLAWMFGFKPAGTATRLAEGR